MNCREMELHAIPYLDGKLVRKEAEAVQRHLAECAACADRLRSFAEIGTLLEAWEPMQPSASFQMRLQQRILAEAAAATGWRERLSQWLPVNSLAKPALAGALFSMMLVAVLLARFAPETGEVLTAGTAPAPVVTAGTDPSGIDYDEMALYQQLPVLENLELLSNFEVLQELQTTAQ